MSEPVFIKISEVSSLIGFSKPTIQRWVKRGIFIQPCNPQWPDHCRTTEMFFVREDVNNWLKQFKGVGNKNDNL